MNSHLKLIFCGYISSSPQSLQTLHLKAKTLELSSKPSLKVNMPQVYSMVWVIAKDYAFMKISEFFFLLFFYLGSPPNVPDGVSRRTLLYQHCISLCDSGDLQTEVASDIMGLLMLEVSIWCSSTYIRFTMIPIVKAASSLTLFVEFPRHTASLGLPWHSWLLCM